MVVLGCGRGRVTFRMWLTQHLMTFRCRTCLGGQGRQFNPPVRRTQAATFL